MKQLQYQTIFHRLITIHEQFWIEIFWFPPPLPSKYSAPLKIWFFFIRNRARKVSGNIGQSPDTTRNTRLRRSFGRPNFQVLSLFVRRRFHKQSHTKKNNFESHFPSRPHQLPVHNGWNHNKSSQKKETRIGTVCHQCSCRRGKKERQKKEKWSKNKLRFETGNHKRKNS